MSSDMKLSLVERVKNALKETDLDCAIWGDEVLAELAHAAIDACHGRATRRIPPEDDPVGERNAERPGRTA